MDIIYSYKFTEKDVQKCTEFANKQLPTSSKTYKSRGENSNNKIITDIVVGKLGELGVYKYLKSLKLNVTQKPDFKIYKRGEKSFDCDLKTDKYNIHVKAQSDSSYKRYGSSYLLQRRDPLIKKSNNDIFILCYVDDTSVNIIAVVDVADIIDGNLWGECEVPRFRPSKVAIYLKDFIDVININKDIS